MDDRIRLKHMLEAAREAMEAIKGRSRGDLAKNHIWTLGLVKCIEIIGEAAARLSAETKTKYPQIPWTQIIAMRNRLVHVYFEVDLEQVWKALAEDLPPLVEQLEKVLDEAEI
jgi:uncharacterized protein with HEPN domain